MKLSLLAALLVGTAMASSSNVSVPKGSTRSSGFGHNVHPREYYEAHFYDWMAEYGITFADGQEFVHRLQVFADSDDLINAHNEAFDNSEHTFTMGHNAYSHLTWDEFKQDKGIGVMLLQEPATPIHYAQTTVGPTGGVAQARRMASKADLPAEVDWVKEGAVTEVKDQGSCGSCWSFSTTGSMEGAFYLKHNALKSFSEQELVDCDTYDSGCNGGLMDYSFHWIQQNKGICEEADYPYTATGGICAKSTCKPVPGTSVASWVDVEASEEALMEAVAQQPVSIAIEADQMAFQFYAGGVMTGDCGMNLDHGVLLVGYGTDAETGVDYWKVKNSWGGAWGSEGYIFLERGKNVSGGQCGILMQPSYPVLDDE